MISLVVPIYNVKSYIKEFLASVIAQTYADFEAVLVDDGSNDGTESILDEYATVYPHMRVIHKQNEGVVRTWKRGIQEAKGEYVAFADPDDILKPNMLETLARLVTDKQVDLVIAGIERLENGKIEKMPADKWNLAEGLYEGTALENIKQNLFGNIQNQNNIFFFARWNKLFKKEILLRNLQYSFDDVRFGDDVCFCASAIYDCNSLFYCYEPIYIYRIRSDSLTTVGFDVSQIDNALRLRDSIRQLLEAKGYMNDFVFYNDPSYHIVRLMRKISESNDTKSEKIRFLQYLKSHEYMLQYDLKRAKHYISKRRFWAIWLLKHSLFSVLLKLL